jgi:hypothetical protein
MSQARYGGSFALVGGPGIVESHADELKQLPRDEAFTAAEVPVTNARLKRWQHAAVVETVERVPDSEGNTSPGRWTYQLTDPAKSKLDDLLETRDTICPCGHSGVRNEGDHYQCLFDDCDRRFERSELASDGGAGRDD